MDYFRSTLGNFVQEEMLVVSEAFQLEGWQAQLLVQETLILFIYLDLRTTARQMTNMEF